MRRRMQIIFQDPYGSLDPRMTVSAIIAEPIETHNLASGDAKHERIAELLRLVGLDPMYVNRYPHEFSGGQRQRIGVARALAVEPEFIVCDEPISALDVSIQAQVLNLLTDLKRRLGLTYLFVAHDLSVVKHISDRVAVMYLGRVVEVGPPDILYAAPGHPYTRALLSAVPVPDPVAERKRRRVILKGDVPSPVNPPPGCRFHTRCWLYERLGQPENCRTDDPMLQPVAGVEDHRAACHYADEALKTDVGIAHLDDTLVRRGTPPAALASLAASQGGRGRRRRGSSARASTSRPRPSMTCRRTPPPSRPATGCRCRIRPTRTRHRSEPTAGGGVASAARAGPASAASARPWPAQRPGGAERLPGLRLAEVAGALMAAAEVDERRHDLGADRRRAELLAERAARMEAAA